MLLAALRHDLKLDVEETGHRGHAVELAREARRDGLDLVVVFGGDGTVNEVVNGLLDGASGHRVPDLAIVPGGSTNVLARNLGLPEDPVEATGLVLDAVPLAPPHAVGARPARREVVHLLRGVGFDADVIRRVEEQRERGKRSTVGLYTRAAIRRFFAQEDRSEGQIVLECDGSTRSRVSRWPSSPTVPRGPTSAVVRSTRRRGRASTPGWTCSPSGGWESHRLFGTSPRSPCPPGVARGAGT